MANNGRLFNKAAPHYRKYRPIALPELGQWVAESADLKRGARILEIGCGAGQATALFTGLAPRQTSIDPGQKLIDICQQSFARQPGYDFQCVGFEDYQAPANTFDLVYAATSFHWLEPRAGYVRAISLLKPGGYLAIVTDKHAQRTVFFAEVQAIYRQIAPELARESCGPQVAPPESGAELTLISQARFERRIEYTAEQYIGLLHTFSDHLALGDERLERLCLGIHQLINRRFNGWVQKNLTTEVHLYQSSF